MTLALDLDAFGHLLASVPKEFADLDFVAGNGVLDLSGEWAAVDRVRVELPPDTFLHLASIGLWDPSGAVLTDDAEVAVSSWMPGWDQRFDAQALFDVGAPKGTAVHTGADQPPWLEIKLSRPAQLARILLRNVPGDSKSLRGVGIRVSVRSAGRWLTAYDHEARVADLERMLAEHVAPWRREARRGLLVDRFWWALRSRIPFSGSGRTRLPRRLRPPRDLDRLVRVVLLTEAAKYREARSLFHRVDLSDADTKAFRALMSRELLLGRGLEWTIHGPTRSFRFWSAREKADYVEFTTEIATMLGGLSPSVSFGFGSVLATVRDHGLIPHDDDLDLIVGFESHEARTIEEALALVESFCAARGYTVTGEFATHRRVSRDYRKGVDVFVGLFEGDVISWYPGPRGTLTRSLMFPTSERELCGVPVPLPRDPEEYLRRVYGDGWVIPNPEFAHTWDRSAYADLVSPAATSA